MRRTPVTAFRRQAHPVSAQAVARTDTVGAPTKGWVSNTNLTKGLSEAALVLDNGFPTKTGVRMRGGSTEYFDSGSTDPISALLTYSTSGTAKIFAANASTIWDITSSPSSVVTGQTSGAYSSQQMDTAGGSFLYVVNGADKPRLYNGATWTAIDGASTPAITGVTTTTLSHVWVYKKRLYFVKLGTSSVFYLPLDSIGGAVTEVSLRGIFQRGGYVLSGDTWSLDAGDGMDDRCVFISDQGEVAVYEGDDPGAANWAIVGRYDLGGKPLGKNAMMRVAGDLLIATDDGFIPMSQVLTKDPEALSLAAISYAIEPDWRRESAARQSVAWSIQKWPEQNMAIVGTPVTSGITEPQCFVVNLQTGAWARYTGWDVRCMAVHGGQLYFGSSAGRVFSAETGGTDDGGNYTMAIAMHSRAFGRPGAHKEVTQARATFRAARPVKPKLSVSTDYAQRFPSVPQSPADYVIDVFDSGLWDEALWDASSSATVRTTRWVPVTGSGYAHMPQVQATSGTTPAPDAELMQIDVQFQDGGVVV